VLVFIIAALLQGPAAFDVRFQQEQAARTVYAACLFRENDDRRRRTGVASLESFGGSCEAERAEVVRLERVAGNSADKIAAGIQGMEETLRESITRMNRFYPAKRH